MKTKLTPTYLLCKYRKSFDLLSPDTYGASTWGTSSQDDIVKKRKYWYAMHWQAGNEYIDDETFQERLNVVVESKNFKNIEKYLLKYSPASLEKISHERESIDKLFKDIFNWVNKHEN